MKSRQQLIIKAVNNYKLRFFLDYVFYKLFYLPFAVKKPKIKFYVYELLYSLLKIIDKTYMFCYPFTDKVVETDYGKFFIRPKTTDAVVVSPGYEHLDRKKLVLMVNKLIKKGRKVLFVDAGANIGSYSVYVGRQFLKDIKIIAIEANPYNFDLLIKNIKINKLEEIIEPYNIILWDKDDDQMSVCHNDKNPGCSFVTKTQNNRTSTLNSKTLDSLLKDNTKKFDVLILKIDVEGSEEKVLNGAKHVFNRFKEVFLIVESFDNKMFENLLKLGFKRLFRFSPYNIWAHKVFGV